MMSRTQEHPVLGTFDVVGTAINLSKVPRTDQCYRHTPEISEHTEDVLGDLGYDAAAIAKLREAKVI
jgi:crotonobetainyl-CoA:carnitine CoA-transferase CaiB-like acyl-CoA transferase